MIARRYKPEDFPDVQAWGAEYGAKYSAEQFPETGFIVDGVAAYFLYKTDSACCWLENMVAKRGVEYNIREKALELIIDAILAEARALGFKVAYASTERFNVAIRAKQCGAKVTPNHIHLALKLEK